MKKLLLTLLILFVSCSPESNIKPTMDRTDSEISITLIFYPNKSSLDDAYRIANKLHKNDPVPDQWGFAEWNEMRDADGNLLELPKEQYACVVHTYQPQRQNDRYVLTMGHELLHCVYGSYHE